jgi:hypothetical protein
LALRISPDEKADLHEIAHVNEVERHEISRPCRWARNSRDDQAVASARLARTHAVTMQSAKAFSGREIACERSKSGAAYAFVHHLLPGRSQEIVLFYRKRGLREQVEKLFLIG